MRGIMLPVIQAALEIQRGKPTQAIQLLEAPKPYERATQFWPAYLRGQAYLKLHRGTEAAAEFQRILDHRGEGPLSLIYPLAHLGLARASARSGDTAKSRKAYQDFLALWKDADPEMPILRESKSEYAKLK
jgi:predicted Zn-dependent protease